MSTVLAFGNSEGTKRCDARCYDAKELRCDCICQGMNHGKGQDVATDNSYELAQRWLEGSGYTEILGEGVFAPKKNGKVADKLLIERIRTRKPCGTCHGEGRSRGGLCPQCGGSGEG